MYIIKARVALRTQTAMCGWWVGVVKESTEIVSVPITMLEGHWGSPPLRLLWQGWLHKPLAVPLSPLAFVLLLYAVECCL